VWHPVGDLPAGVYWRRRLVVLLVLLALLAGGGWLGWWLVTGRGGGSTDTGATAARAQVRPPALERVVPSLGGVRTPEAGTGAAADVPADQATTLAEPAPPAEGGPCTDDVLALEVRAPATVPVGSKPTLELVVRNASAVSCVRVLDKELQEIALFDAAGTRVWGSNDCFPEASDDARTLAPGEEVVFPLVWGGLTSDPTCTVARTTPAPGNYVLRGRLDTKVSADTPIQLA
jgi:hypothetical protein